MATYRIKLLEKTLVAQNTMKFTFEKPDDFDFKAGQFLDWTQINPKEMDGEGSIRAFSIIYAPHEGKLGFTTRMRDSAFKKNMFNMNLSEEIQISNAMGNYILHNDVFKPAVFLIGGIGITPVRSMIIDSTFKKSGHKLYLFYSNRTPEDAPFLDEFNAVQNENFHFVPTMTRVQESKQQWSGETGYITWEMVTKYINDPSSIYYLSGPEEMVSSMRKLLNDNGVDSDYIKVEEFPGYELEKARIINN